MNLETELAMYAEYPDKELIEFSYPDPEYHIFKVLDDNRKVVELKVAPWNLKEYEDCPLNGNALLHYMNFLRYQDEAYWEDRMKAEKITKEDVLETQCEIKKEHKIEQLKEMISFAEDQIKRLNEELSSSTN